MREPGCDDDDDVDGATERGDGDGDGEWITIGELIEQFKREQEAARVRRRQRFNEIIGDGE